MPRMTTGRKRIFKLRAAIVGEPTWRTCGLVVPKKSANGSVARLVWDLATLHEESYVLRPDQTAQAELAAWSKLWQPGTVTFAPRGVDSWSIGELRMLQQVAFEGWNGHWMNRHGLPPLIVAVAEGLSDIPAWMDTPARRLELR
eukprot:3654242-Amphidinium_carterae.4